VIGLVHGQFGAETCRFFSERVRQSRQIIAECLAPPSLVCCGHYGERQSAGSTILESRLGTMNWP
jgi:hypothetical protein